MATISPDECIVHPQNWAAWMQEKIDNSQEVSNTKVRLCSPIDLRLDKGWSFREVLFIIDSSCVDPPFLIEGCLVGEVSSLTMSTVKDRFLKCGVLWPKEDDVLNLSYNMDVYDFIYHLQP